MVLHPTTESKSKLENCGVGVQRSMGTKKVEGPWHGHHGQLLKENYDPLKFEDFWGWGQTLGAHLILLPVFLLLSVSLAEIRLICGGAGHKGYDGDHNCTRSFFHNCWERNCGGISLVTIVLWGPARPQPCGVQGSEEVEAILGPVGLLPDRGGRLEDVEVLQDVRHGHQAQGAQETEACVQWHIFERATKDWPTYPGTVQIYGYKRWRDGEVVDKGVKLQHEPELVRGSDELKRVVVLIHFIISSISEVMNWNIIIKSAIWVLTLMKK